VLCETRGRVVSETQLHTVRVKVRNELRRIEDADSHVRFRAVNVISLLAPSGANPICLLGADGNYEFVAGIPGMPPLWSNAEPDDVSAEVGSVNAQFPCEIAKGHKLVRCFHLLHGDPPR